MARPMFGFFFHRLHAHVLGRLGEKAWQRVLEEADLDPDRSWPPDTAPPIDFATMASTASELAELPLVEWLEGFGTALAPHALALVRDRCDPEWDAMELLARSGGMLRAYARTQSPVVPWPALLSTRIDPDEVLIVYGSSRRLCPLAHGLIVGIGRERRTRIEVDHVRCMLFDDPECEFRIRRA